MENNLFSFRIEEQEEEIYTPFFPNQEQNFDEQKRNQENIYHSNKCKEENEIIDLLKDLIMEESKENN